jgi:hypothetical protein
MPVQVEQLISSLGLIEAQTAEHPYPYLVILRDPENGEMEIPVDGLISFVLVQLFQDPSITTPYDMNCLVQVSFNGGDTWINAYDGGTFLAPFDGGSSAVIYHSPTDPYVYNGITIDYTGNFDDSSTVMVRMASSLTGWGHSPWGHSPWGHPSSLNLYTEGWSFAVEDLTSPKLMSAQAIDRKIVRLTYDDDMRSGTPDGRARLLTGTPGTWDLSTGGETLTVVVDGGEVQTIVFQTYMWLDPSAVTAEEVAFALSALVTGGMAEFDGVAGVYLYSETVGDTSTIQITGGSANSQFAFPTDAVSGSSEGVLAPENYTIDRHNVYPEVAVHLTVEAVSFVEDSLTQVDLTCQWEMTPRAPYSVTVDSDVADTSNNDIDPDFVLAEFIGFEPEWPEDRDAEIKFPQGVFDADPMRVARALINMAQEMEDLKITDVDELWDVWNIDTCNDPTVALMLYEAGNPFTTLDLTDSQRRNLVDLLPFIYAQKGLPDGLTSTILSLLGIPVTIENYTQNSWRLGVDRLGSDYPAKLWSANPGPYPLTGGGTLLIKVDEGEAQTITFLDTDFVDPAVATTEEVAVVIDSQLNGGGANIFDDGGGPRFELFSTTWGSGGSIQVTGGTLTAIFGFDTTIESGSGGCMLGPSTSRMKRTFDLVYSDVVPSSDEVAQMRKIANFMKPVDKHLGKIRPAKTIPTPDYWLLGFNLLGTDTVLGE